MKKLGIYAMNEKGLAVVAAAIDSGIPIAHITTAQATGMNDASDQTIKLLAKAHGIPTFLRAHPPEFTADVSIAAGWRWLLDVPELVILHDSLLPRYRGFSPLITALLNGETEVGVTAFMAREEPDTGPIVTQRSTPVSYPVRMRTVLDRVVDLYDEITKQVCADLLNGEPLRYVEQDHSQATYSVWRDDQDYRIDWAWDAYKILRLVDAASHPFPGAWTTLAIHPEDSWMGDVVRVYEAAVVPDVRIEDRRPGKVLRLDNDLPVVVCGMGLLRLESVGRAHGAKRFPLRSRFQ